MGEAISAHNARLNVKGKAGGGEVISAHNTRFNVKGNKLLWQQLKQP
jgi:hypothetical protein